MSARQDFLIRQLTRMLAGLMTAQAILGLVRRDLYRDQGWITATWLGNDWTTLLLAVPVLLAADIAARNGSTRGRLALLGALAYATYNYAFYLLGAALNAFFPLFAVCVVVAGVSLIHALSQTDAGAVARSFSARTPVRFIGGAMCAIAVSLTAVWMVLWVRYVFANRPLPVEPEAFKVVAALDLTLMVPVLAIAGLLAWRRHPLGFVLAPMACIQAAMYLLVLTVNSVIAIRTDLVAAPGELPIWSTLALALIGMTVTLLAHLRRPNTEERFA